ncbi:PEP-CTERM sorting domain-containing protein [Calothrix membranacea FACHB-236]|nr:PEP-CTERM sorting domain-containing protein [Calothrix membranacea FACHB-236]
MNKHTAFISALVVTTGVALAATAMPASAVTFGFNNITNGDTVGDAYNSKFSFDVIDQGNNNVLFKFANNSLSALNEDPTIKQIAFSVDSTVSSLLSGMTFNSSFNTSINGVNFTSDTSNLSQSNKIAGWDGTTFGAKTSGANANGVQTGEALGIKFTGNYNNILTAISTGKLQIGIHAGSLANGASDAYVNTTSYVSSAPPQAVPEPATIFGLMAFGMGGLLTRKNGKNAKKEVLPVKVTA